VAAEELGVTLPHEHLFIDLLREYRDAGLLRDEALAIEEVQAFAALGGRTIVDVTSVGLGRNPRGLAAVARATGVNVVMGSGFYRHPYLDRDWFDRHDASAIAEVIVRDLSEGVDGTGVRAGIIGEVGCDAFISAAEERSFRAAARAHQATGVTISTHAARWPVGLAQLDLLENEGVDPTRVIVGHADTVPDAGYRIALARRGAWVQLDTIQGENAFETDRRVDWIAELLDAGFGDRVLLSHDVCLATHLRARGGSGYAYLLDGFVPRLRERGLDEPTIRRLLVDNPRRALTGA
jgi:phosphotriesterase-related protein